MASETDEHGLNEEAPKRLSNLEVLINEELKEWQKEGLNPGALGVANPWAAHNSHLALAELLIEKKIITPEDLDMQERIVMLRELKACRARFGAEVRKARILEGITVRDSLQ